MTPIPTALAILYHLPIRETRARARVEHQRLVLLGGLAPNLQGRSGQATDQGGAPTHPVVADRSPEGDQRSDGPVGHPARPSGRTQRDQSSGCVRSVPRDQSRAACVSRIHARLCRANPKLPACQTSCQDAPDFPREEPTTAFCYDHLNGATPANPYPAENPELNLWAERRSGGTRYRERQFDSG